MSLNTKLGDINCDSYVATAYANSYFGNRPNSSSWTNIASPGAKEHALRQACIEIDLNNFTGDRYYDIQRRQFPRDDHETYTGACASPTKTQFKGSNLWSSTYNLLPTNYFKNGTVHITYGTCVGDTRVIASSDGTNGMVTVTESFTATLDTTSNYLVFAPLDNDICRSQCEQALYGLDSSLQKYIEFKNQGIGSVMMGDVSVNFQRYGSDTNTILSPLGFFAKTFLGRFLRRGGKIARA